MDGEYDPFDDLTKEADDGLEARGAAEATHEGYVRS